MNDVFQNTSRVHGGVRSGNIKPPKKKKRKENFKISFSLGKVLLTQDKGLLEVLWLIIESDW